MASLNGRVERLERDRGPMVFEVWVEALDQAGSWRNVKTGEVATAEQIAERGRRFTLEFDRPQLIKIDYVDGEGWRDR